jgi:hypothetical protein
MTAESLEKNDIVLEAGLRSLEICKRHGVPVAVRQRPLGRAALGPEPRVHAGGARLWLRSRSSARQRRSRRKSCAWKARSARFGPGAFADLLVVDGDPLQDLALLEDQGKHLSVIMKAGKFHKRRLN